MPELRIGTGSSLADALVAAKLSPSKTRARHDIETNAVVLDGARASADVTLADGVHVVRFGKNRFARVIVAP